MIVPLNRSYANRHAVPAISRVDTDIFNHCHHADCQSSTCCIDDCCAHGVCVDLENRARIEANADHLEAYLGIPRSAWFDGAVVADADSPGGAYVRTRVRDGACVFLNRSGRGCRLHAFCLSEGIDHYQLKPMLSSLFPTTVEGGLLRPSCEVLDATLVCLNRGISLYRGSRGSLGHYYGAGLLEELDLLERRTLAGDLG